MPGTNRAVFLDRDGTIVEDPGYLHEPGQLKLLEGAADAIARLRRDGFAVILATNQSAIARGLMTEDDLAAVHERLAELLVEADPDALLDGIYYCPYHPEAEVSAYRQESYLRKPRPGMLFKAARQFQLDLGSCWMVGDSERDVQAGRAAGCRTIRLDADPEADTQADRVCPSLAEAAAVVLASPGRTPLRSADRPTPEPSVPAAPPQEEPPMSQTQPEPDAQAEPAVEPAVEPAAEPAAEAAGRPATADELSSPDAPAPGSPAPAHVSRPLGATRRKLLDEIQQEAREQRAAAPAADPADDPAADRRERQIGPGDVRRVLAEILQQLRQLNRGPEKHALSATKILGGLLQAVSWAIFAVAMISFWNNHWTAAVVWGIVAVFAQVSSLSFFLMHQQD